MVRHPRAIFKKSSRAGSHAMMNDHASDDARTRRARATNARVRPTTTTDGARRDRVDARRRRRARRRRPTDDDDRDPYRVFTSTQYVITTRTRGT